MLERILRLCLCGDFYGPPEESLIGLHLPNDEFDGIGILSERSGSLGGDARDGT